MRGVALSALTILAAAMAQPAFAAPDSVGAPAMQTDAVMAANTGWASANGAPGAGGAQRRLAYGDRLPREWMADAYWIDAKAYRLPRPARGFGWSRYYGDAVLTDQWGRIYDSRPAYDFEHRGRRYRGGRDLDRGDGWGSSAQGMHWREAGYLQDEGDFGEDVVTTVVTREGECRMVPREVVTYSNVYAPVYGAQPLGKVRRTTASRPRVRGDF